MALNILANSIWHLAPLFKPCCQLEHNEAYAVDRNLSQSSCSSINGPPHAGQGCCKSGSGAVPADFSQTYSHIQVMWHYHHKLLS